MRKVAILVVLLLAAPAYALNLTIYTEEFPPFNYTRNNKIDGVATEVVQHVMAKTGFAFTIQSRPWSESYERAQKEQNALIYSISRRENREPLFKWIDILTPTTYSVKSLRSRNDIDIKRLSDMKKYKIGTNVDDVVEVWLLSKGFTLNDFTRTTGKHSVVQNYKNLLNKQIDLWPSPDAVAYYIAREQGQSNPGQIMKSVYPLQELSGGYYIAGSLNTPDLVIEAIKKALVEFKKSDQYYKILAHWGVDAMGLKASEPVGKLVYTFRHLARTTKVGYIANDSLKAHKEGGLYRKEIREEFVERYAKTFEQWQILFKELQSQVDAIIIGDVKGIRGWSDRKAQRFALKETRVPTGFLLNGMSAYSMLGYEGNDLVINKKIAARADVKIPKGVLKKASLVIE